MNESSLLAYEGTSIKADNTYLGLTKDTVIKGRTLQNVFDYTKVVSTNALRQNNEIFSSNRVTWDYSFKVSDIILKPSTEYTVFIDYNKGTYTGSPEFRSNITTLLISPTFKMESSGVYRFKSMTQSEINLDSSLIYFKGGNPSNVEGNFSFQIMILEGDYTQTPLEELPFIEGIESTGDKSKNLFFGAFEEGQINSETGEEIAYNGRCRSVQYANIEPNKTYTVSMVQNVVSAPWTSIRLYKDNTFIKTVQDLHGKAKFTFESGEANRLRVTANISYNDVINCQIEEGTQATPYQEYYDGYKISGKSCGKNLCNGEVINNLALNLDGSEVYSLYSQTLRYVRVKPNTNYIFSNEPSYSDRQVIIEYDKNKNVLRNCFTDVNCRFTTGHDTNYISYYFYKGNLAIERSADINFQLEEGTTATSYEPYQESNYSYILNEPLRSLPNGVCDEIDLTTGVLTRRVGVKVIDGTIGRFDNWASEGDIFSAYLFMEKTPEIKYIESEINTYSYPLPSETTQSIRGGTSEGTSTGGGGQYPSYFAIGVRKDKLESPDIEGLKKYLGENPLTVHYDLKTPTTEQLTQQQLKSFDTTTHIISDNKLMPIVSTKIPSDVNAVVQNLKAENVKLEKQLDSAIEELNNTDVDLIAMDWETDYRLCELEWALHDTMKVETLAESKAVESRILSRYEQAKILIVSGKYNKSTMEKQLTMYYNRNYLTKEEFNELMQLMNPIGEVETLEELDKAENI